MRAREVIRTPPTHDEWETVYGMTRVCDCAAHRAKRKAERKAKRRAVLR